MLPRTTAKAGPINDLPAVPTVDASISRVTGCVCPREGSRLLPGGQQDGFYEDDLIVICLVSC